MTERHKPPLRPVRTDGHPSPHGSQTDRTTRPQGEPVTVRPGAGLQPGSNPGVPDGPPRGPGRETSRSAVQIPQPANDPRYSPNAIQQVPGRTAEERGVTVSRTGSRWWRLAKRSAITVLVLVGAAVVALAALQIRLGKGPIVIPQLVGPIERGLSKEFGDTQVQVGGVALYRAEQSRRIEIRINDLRLIDALGNTVVRVPTAAIDISRNALLLWTIAPKRIDLIRPRLVMSYTEGAGLSLRFAGFDARASGAPAENVTAQSDIATVGDRLKKLAQQVDADPREAVGLVQVLQDTFRTARERKASTSFLKSIGVRDAVVVLRTKDNETTWTAPALALELRHQSSRSIIRGNGTLTDGTAPWAFAFEIDDTPARGAFQVRTLFKDLVPREFGRAVPSLSNLSALETPLSGQADFQLAQNGSIVAASADVVVGAGYMSSGSQDGSDRVLLDEGHLKFAYDGERDLVRLEKLDLLTGGGRIVLAGQLSPAPGRGDEAGWLYELNGKLRFASAAAQGGPLSDITATGLINPSDGLVRIDRMNVAWPEGQIAGRGQYSLEAGMSLTGQLGEMSKTGLLQAWPDFIAVDARKWVNRNISTKLITGGQFSISLPPDFRERLRNGSDIPAEAVSFDLAATGMQIQYIEGVPPVRLEKATVSIRGRRLHVKAPRGVTRLPSGKTLRLSQSDLTIRDLRPVKPTAQIFMKVTGSAAALTEYLELRGMGYLEPGTVPVGVKGKAEGIIRLSFPMHAALTDAEIKLNGKLKLTDGAAKRVFSNMSIAGASVDFDLTEKAVEATGDILVNGVPAKVRWLRLLDGPEDKQPPLRISAKLDAADRKQLGLNINHFLTGVIATDVTIISRKSKSPQITVQADLTQSEISLDYLAWSKAAGQSAIAQFDVVPKKNGISELQNFKIVGDSIAIDGWIELGKDSRVRRFALPEFSINVITRMDVSGALDKNNVWDVKVRASTFDARPIFRNLFSPKRFTEHAAPKEARRAGFVIRAFIKNMVGFSNASVKDMQIVFERRDGKVTGLEANGALDSGAPIAVSLKANASKRRVLYAETKDAGAAFRLVGFYRNIRNGEAKLQVNLDDPGLADVSGVLWTRKFLMLGDPIVNEVLQSSGRRDDSGTVSGIKTRRDERGQKRTVIEFDQLRFNFSVGEGQFLLHKSYVNGPALGATLNGKVDFDRRRVSLGGTYVPLYGLNSALGSLPILGELLVGRIGEGVLGITFGIQGRLDKPEVLVNPVSLVAPGIFRQIFELSPQRQTITRRRPQDATQKRGRKVPDKVPSSSSWPADSRN